MSVQFIALCVLSLISFSHLEAHFFYNPNLRYECYELIDLGSTDIDSETLSRGNFPSSLGPRINDNGHITGNTSQGGFVFDRVNPRKFLQHKTQAAFIYDINNKGLVLASIKYDARNVEWLLWPYGCFCERETLAPLNLKCLDGKDVYFRSFNDKNVIVGSRRVDNGWQSIFYTPDKGVRDLTCAFVSEINEYGNMAGYEANSPRKTPLLYHYRGGWSGFSDEERIRAPTGGVFQMDMAIAPDSTVFGSFESYKNEMPYIWGYSWNACEGSFRLHDFNGMQISAANSCHTLVGTVAGIAVISNNMEPPIPLASRLSGGCPKGLSLIEATDINDMGEIVAFGTWLGSMHLFLLKPVR